MPKAKHILGITMGNDVRKKLGIQSSSVDATALNPHASDAGLFGSKEENKIIPAIEAAKFSGIHAESLETVRKPYDSSYR
jgi:4-hydroxy-L-threonine phosphate dehydrogenase PdxA